MIIGMTGKARSGKDTVGDYLVDAYGFTKTSLAAPIKRLVKDVFVLTYDQVYDEVEREKPLPQWNDWSVRKLLQVVGSEGLRTLIDPQIWAKSLWYRIKEELEHQPNVNFVITDLRFPDELDYLHKNVPKDIHFECWKTVRNGCDGNVGIKGHMTERHDLDADFTLDNNGTFEDLGDIIDNRFGESIYERHFDNQ